MLGFVAARWSVPAHWFRGSFLDRCDTLVEVSNDRQHDRMNNLAQSDTSASPTAKNCGVFSRGTLSTYYLKTWRVTRSLGELKMVGPTALRLRFTYRYKYLNWKNIFLRFE